MSRTRVGPESIPGQAQHRTSESDPGPLALARSDSGSCEGQISMSHQLPIAGPTRSGQVASQQLNELAARLHLPQHKDTFNAR